MIFQQLCQGMWLKLNCGEWARLLLSPSALLLAAVNPCLMMVTCWLHPTAASTVSDWHWIYFTELDLYTTLELQLLYFLFLLTHTKTSRDFGDLQNYKSKEESFFTKSQLFFYAPVVSKAKNSCVRDAPVTRRLWASYRRNIRVKASEYELWYNAFL